MSEPTAPQLESIGAGRYEVRGLLGQGGMAAVYRVYDRRLRVECAIKVLAAEFSAKGDLRKRFESEATTMARLRHTNIAAVYDIGDDNGSPYLVMELIPGGSLNDYLEKHGPLPSRMAVEVCISVLTALQVAHDNGVVHRDIKPHNVLLGRDGVAKVTDFGIARVQADDSPSMTRTGSVMGTWAYMAPEQRAGSRGIDGRADIYSTGAMLVDLLTGEAAADVFMCEMHTQMLDAVPEPLRPIVQRAVRYKPAERYASASEMAEALRDAIPGLPTIPASHPRLGADSKTASTASPSGLSPSGTYVFDDLLPGPARVEGPLTIAPGAFEAHLTMSRATRVPELTQPPDEASLDRSTPARGRVRWVVGAVAVIALVVGGVWWGSGGNTPVVAVPEGGAHEPKVSVAAPAVGAPDLVVATPAEPLAPTVVAPSAAVVASPGVKTKPATKPVATAAPVPAPAVALAAPVEVKPVAAPPETPPATPVGNGTVRVSGDADSVVLVGNGGRFPPGDVAAGTYSIEASFGGGAPAPAGKVTVTGGQSVTIKCVADFARCK